MDQKIKLLRQKAHKILEEKPVNFSKSYYENDLNYLLQELEIYHAELEAQNNELLQKEQEIYNANKENEKLFFNAPIPYLLIDKDFFIKKANIKAHEYFQFHNFNLQEKSFLSLLINKDLQRFFDWISNKDLESLPIELNFYTNDRTKILSFKIHGTIFDEKKSIMLSLTNIQKEKQLISELQNKDNLLLSHIQLAAQSEILSIISHHWKQPLNVLSSVSSSLKLLFDDFDLNKKDISRLLDMQEGTIMSLSTIIEDFINLENKGEECKLFDDKCFIKSIKSLSLQFLKNQGIKFEIQSSVFTKFNLNSIDLLKVIIKIIKNSCEAIESNEIKNPEINIVIKEEENILKITIEDNAKGINEKLLKKVFDPYFSTKSLNNLGLGLYMSKQIIEKELKGTIEIKNTNYGILTTICLPKKSIDENDLLLLNTI